VDLVNVDDVRAAAQRLTDVVQRTPVELSRALSAEVGRPVLLKCENLQRAGSFKIRGATNRITQLDEGEQRRGVVCASAGNHAQGVALAAAHTGVAATVFMPVDAPLPKVEATEAYGAAVRLEGSAFDEALANAVAFAEATNAVFVHPFDHPDIIAGQGTIGLELDEQLPADVAAVVVPVGGGGLISGVAAALRDLRPGIRIIGVQAAGCAPFPASLASGRPEALPRADTIADGIAVKRPGVLTLAHVHALVDEVVTVDDDAIASAVVHLLERAKLVVEPAGAVAVAAVRAGLVDADGPLGIILSGGNIDPLLLRGLITSGLAAEGRYLTFTSRISDSPGSLMRLLKTIAHERGNVIGVEHHRFAPRLRYGQVEVLVELEMRGPEHITQLTGVLRDAGYPIKRV